MAASLLTIRISHAAPLKSANAIAVINPQINMLAPHPVLSPPHLAYPVFPAAGEVKSDG